MCTERHGQWGCWRFWPGFYRRQTFSNHRRRSGCALCASRDWRALICFVSFVGVLLVYRAKLNSLRDKCRGVIGKLLEGQVTRPANLLVLPISTEPIDPEMIPAKESAGA